jgi:hypothetical protein
MYLLDHVAIFRMMTDAVKFPSSNAQGNFFYFHV